ncbi:MAG: transposase [Tatlockia sp.]|nr:transposase [Tatlockia sp.]
MSKRTRNYDKEFKLNAVILFKESGKSYNVISEELGIPTSTLVGWVKDHEASGAKSFPGKGNIKQSDIEIMQLRKELAIAREERDILKKALGIFSSLKK